MDTAALESIASKEDLAELIDELRRDLVHNPDTWENVDLAAYLEALAGWLRDMEGYYEHRGEPVPTWKLLGEILPAVKMYEKLFRDGTKHGII